MFKNREEKCDYYRWGTIHKYGVVKYIVHSVRKSFQDNVRVFTNGSLVTKEISMCFAKNNVYVLVSFDGPK